MVLVCRTDTLEAYADYLLTTPEETKELFSDLLISVTMFFRDPGAFAALERLVVGPLFDELDPGAETGIRAWVVGCATGEEAYSLAMLLYEEAARRKLHPQVQIFATDLDEGALATAREGRYPRTIEADLSEERLARFFVNEGTHYRVRKELRDNVVFARHSAIKEPPFMRLDLVTCRNLLIYLERSLQQQLCTLFHYGLKPGRFLFLGSAETADTAADLFAPLDRDARIYGARPHTLQTLPILPQFAVPEQLAGPAPLVRPERPDQPGTLHVAALERSAPPSALVDDGHSILHLSPTAGQFIQPSAGPLSNLLPAVVRPELRLDLRLALTRALESKEPTLTHPVTIVMDGGLRRIAMHVIPVADAAHIGAQALVLFLDGGAASEDERADTVPDTRPDEVRRLHAELKASQEALVASRTGHDTAIQDLRATNEELQSINEELHTVNAELKSKLGSISIAHSDLQNLTSSTEIGTLFLDPELRIRMFTPPVAELFNIAPTDIGRAITDFTNRLDYDRLEADVRLVLRDLAPVEAVVRSRDGQQYVVRLRPYRTVEDRIDGTVVTFVDNTARLEAEAAVSRSEQQLRALVTASSQVLYRMNPSWTQMRVLVGGGFLSDTEQPSDNWLIHYIPPEDQDQVQAEIRKAIDAKATFDLEHRVLRLDGTIGWTHSRAIPLLDESGNITEWFGSASDITQRKQLQEQQQVLVAELQHRTRNLLGMVRNVARRSIEPSPGRDQYDARLSALGRVQGFLSRGSFYAVRLADLVEAELTAAGDGTSDRVTMSGPVVELPGEGVQTVALALHELATNAAKYGALNQPSGRLAVTWRVEATDGAGGSRLVIDWRESGVAMPDKPPLHQGYGSELITKALPYQLRAETLLEFKADGVWCRMSLPAGTFEAAPAEEQT